MSGQLRAAPSPQDAVERALQAATCDDCVVIADESSAANLRWAANSLTTNGVSRTRQLTVIAIRRRGDAAAVGVVSRAGVTDDQIPGIVAEAEHQAADGSPADDAQPLAAVQRRLLHRRRRVFVPRERVPGGLSRQRPLAG